MPSPFIWLNYCNFCSFFNVLTNLIVNDGGILMRDIWPHQIMTAQTSLIQSANTAKAAPTAENVFNEGLLNLLTVEFKTLTFTLESD